MTIAEAREDAPKARVGLKKLFGAPLVVAVISSLIGCAPPPPRGGIVMLAFPSLLLNALSPEMARQQWLLVRQRFDHGSWKRLF
tara:strand:- start:778 stop:1029 length:252 start_codon:yes stop_codon:yes gene_type:complete